MGGTELGGGCRLQESASAEWRVSRGGSSGRERSGELLPGQLSLKEIMSPEQESPGARPAARLALRLP